MAICPPPGDFLLPSPGGRYLQCAHWRGMRGTPKGLRFFRRKRPDVDSLPLIRHGCAVPPSPRGRQFLTLPNSTKRAIISSAHGYALALPVFGRREAPSSGGGHTSFIKPPLSWGEVVHMVTHSELILIGQLIVSVLTLFVHIYNNKKK